MMILMFISRTGAGIEVTKGIRLNVMVQTTTLFVELTRVIMGVPVPLMIIDWRNISVMSEYSCTVG
jgi:hypothetical protein